MTRSPLPADARVCWDAFTNALGELPAAIGDAEVFDAAFGAIRQISRGLNVQQLADPLEMPEDAGEYADALREYSCGFPMDGGAG
ncbi:MAG: hypothetical protein ACR2ND_06140 [Solirubrobacteraceae bacterium]